LKISDFEVFVVANPPPHNGGLYWIFVKLVTDTGIVGVGEVYSIPFHHKVAKRMVEDICERFLVGADPFRIERLWRLVYSQGFTQRSDLSVMGCLSGVETACWDIIGKAVDKPVYELLGGRVHERLRSYTYIYPDPPDDLRAYSDPETAARRARHYADLGFTALKFDPVGPYTAFDPRQLSLDALDRAENLTAAVREAVGSRCDLLFGTHGQMTASSALRLAERIAKYDPLWLEEPVPPDNVDEMARVARQTTIPVATGERVAGKYDFARILKAQAASILQMAIGRVGGILEAKKIAGMAEAHYAQIAPHLYCGPIEGAANVQLDTCTPNFLIQESIRTWDGFHAEILKRPMRWEDGYIIPPTEPGIGVELDEDVARANPYTGDALHLDMTKEPL